ncbi:MAG: hypothetical protein EOO07_00130 [Chitinophagaceae bacterium]|nr:MAG: hypothetical protein EOO07_00130 [Chitinophagaceae bacterium]
MQPTEHKHKKDDELIAHIKQSLKTHEEVYQIGAWEKFNESQQTKKRPVFWFTRLSGAAAILAVCVSLIWYSTNSPQNEQLTKQKAPKDNTPTQDQPLTGGASDVESPSVANELLAMETPEANTIDNRSVASAQRDVIVNQKTAEPSTQVAINATPAEATVKTPAVVSSPLNSEQVIAKVDEKVKADIVDFLANETQKSDGKIDKLAVNKKQKWDWGIMLAPSFGNTQELNMGYGVSMTYNFSNRLSLSSGIAYNKMNASKNLPTNIGSSSILLGNTKSLEMISEEVTGLDIPLELKYTINKNMYANLGVSGFAVLNQSRRNTFVETVVVKNTVGSSGGTGANGASSSIDNEAKGQFANTYLVNQRTTELASGTTVEDLNYIGFYNLSFGYTKKIYKNHALAIEPFVKLPIRGVTQDNLRLVGTGVRLKVGF